MIGQFIRRVTGQGGTLTLDDPTGWYSSDRPLFGGKEMQAMKLPAVNACIEIISDSIAKMPVYLMDSGTRERVTDHPALRLLTGRPTEALTAFDYHKLMESRRIAYGNAYALILRDKWGVPVELLPIAPGYMMPLLDSNAKLWYVGINPKTQEYRKFWPEDVLHYKAFSTDGLEGVSYLRRGAETIETALQAQRYEGNYYKNGGQVSGVLATETDLSSKTRFDENGNAIDLKNRIRELDDSTRLARIQLIVHCVGDMHCPAHIRYPGNTTIGYYKVDYFGREMRYHTIWDSEIVQRPHPWSFTDLAWLLDRYTEAEQAEITSGTVYDWGRESAAASKCIYDVQPGESIANDFIKKYKPLAESQIAKAGYRLAAVLNDVFGK